MSLPVLVQETHKNDLNSKKTTKKNPQEKVWVDSDVRSWQKPLQRQLGRQTLARRFCRDGAVMKHGEQKWAVIHRVCPPTGSKQAVKLVCVRNDYTWNTSFLMRLKAKTNHVYTSREEDVYSDPHVFETFLHFCSPPETRVERFLLFSPFLHSVVLSDW